MRAGRPPSLFPLLMISHDGKYVVVVEVRDPSAVEEANPTIGYDFVVVVITATDVNDDPVLSGRAELTIDEKTQEIVALMGTDGTPSR